MLDIQENDVGVRKRTVPRRTSRESDGDLRQSTASSEEQTGNHAGSQATPAATASRKSLQTPMSLELKQAWEGK